VSDETVQFPEDGSAPKLPDLDLLRRIGRGAYGDVWLAQNRTTGRLLAVKVVRLRTADAAGRAAREMKALIRFDAGLPAPHENLLTIHHVGQTDDVLYYTMDPADDVSGKAASVDPAYQPATLSRRIEKAPLPPEECLRHAEQLLAGLAHLHAAGLAHRDVKPSNCLFVGGKLKLADFGLVTQADGTSSLLGTPKYMPPKGPMDARADVYAAGLVLYEMFTGLPAERFPQWGAEALKARAHPVLRALNRLVLRACQPEPEQRFANGGEMLAALAEMNTHARAKSRPRWKRLAIAGVALLTAAALAMALWRPSPTRRVDVNFITQPFEAEVYLDGRRAEDGSGKPYTTPCTIPGLPARVHRVVFKLEGLPDLEVGEKDLAATREVVAQWPKAENPRPATRNP